MRRAIHRIEASVLVLLLLNVLAPSRCSAAWEWEPVPADLLKQAKSTIDPDADSEISSMKVTVEDGITAVSTTSAASLLYFTTTTTTSSQRLDHRIRVKVFNAQGAARWSKIAIECPDTGIEISRFEVRTVLPDGAVLDVTPAAGVVETVFDDQYRRVRRWSFAPRGVCAGSVIEYRYHEERTGGRLLGGYFPLQFDVPVREVSYQITPVMTIPFNHVTFNSRPRIVSDQVHNRFEFSAHDQPAYRPEPDMLPGMTERAGFLVYYTDKGNIEPADYWPSIGKSRAGFFESMSRPSNLVKGIAKDSLPSGPATAEAVRLKAILEWCHDRIRVVPGDPDSLARWHVAADADGPAVVRARAGTEWGVNLAFAALCRAEGFEVRCLEAGSHDDVFFDQNWLNWGFLPEQQTAVRMGGEWVSFSPQSRHLPWDMLPAEEEGDYALLCDRDSTCFIMNPLSPPGASVRAKTFDLALQPDGSLDGRMQLEFTGHFNDRVRSELDPGDESLEDVIRRQRLWDGGEAEVTQIESANLARPGEPLRVTARVRIRNHAVPGTRRLLLEPAVMRAHMPPRFKATVRAFPVYFDFAHAELDTVRIHLDGRWKLEQAERLRPVAAGGLGRYEASVAADSSGSTITFLRSLSIASDGQLIYPVAAYGDVRAFFDTVQNRDRVTLSLVPAGGAKP